MIKKYLQLARAHTVPLEAVPAIMGASLAVGTVWHKQVALWGIFGTLYHLAGYSHNSLIDWKNGYDKDDPNKSHHPLNTDALSVTQATRVVRLLLIATVAYAVALIGFDLSGLSVVAFAIISGLAYNSFGKLTEFKFVYISIAHTMVFVAPFVALDGNLGALELKLGIIYMFLWISFQISVSGEVKDITQDEENFLKKMGASVQTEFDPTHYIRDLHVEFSRYVKHYAYSIKTLGFITGLVIMLLLNTSLDMVIFYIALSIVQLNLSIKMLKTGSFNRHKRVKQMSMIEMMTAISFVLAYTQVIGVDAVMAIIGASIIWVVIGNKVLWGTLIGPEV